MVMIFVLVLIVISFIAGVGYICQDFGACMRNKK